MKVQTVVLGEYGSPPAIFALYQIPAPLTPPLSSQIEDEPTTINYYCLEDLAYLFFDGHMDDWVGPLHRDHAGDFCKDQDNRSYIKTELLAQHAKRWEEVSSLSMLFELCNLQEADILSGSADGLLAQISKLSPIKASAVKKEVALRHLDGREWFFRSLSHSQSPSLSPNGDSPGSPSKPSTLWLKRYDPKHDQKKATHLTIATKFHKQTESALYSAPLRPLFSPGSLRPRTANHAKIMKTPSRRLVNVPFQGASKDLPSTPIVPSQQHTPKLATHNVPKIAPKTSLPPLQFNQPRTPLPPLWTSTATNFQHSQAITKKLTPKQQFMQPFEQLYDTIEQTRVSKTKLEDQIRKSAGLLQTLQVSVDNAENIFQDHLHDTVEQQFKQTIDGYMERIVQLEKRLFPNQESAPQDKLSEILGKLDRLEQK